MWTIITPLPPFSKTVGWQVLSFGAVHWMRLAQNPWLSYPQKMKWKIRLDKFVRKYWEKNVMCALCLTIKWEVRPHCRFPPQTTFKSAPSFFPAREIILSVYVYTWDIWSEQVSCTLHKVHTHACLGSNSTSMVWCCFHGAIRTRKTTGSAERSNFLSSFFQTNWLVVVIAFIGLPVKTEVSGWR